MQADGTSANSSPPPLDAEFITMMTGQPYKSPETAAKKEDKAEGTPNPASPSFVSSAAVRGVSTISARLKRQRLANQVYKDAWMKIEPTLKGSITAGELEKIAAELGLEVTEGDVEEMQVIDPSDGQGKITCEYPPTCICTGQGASKTTDWSLGIDERFLEFAKRQEVDDIVSGYGE